ncbi:EXS-domain-containing protein [Tothia fuscella]|uniref:EXS-domain-containing protein n=1 Tax=Tothia fuscella TaxID=1048955 RepID=A0A9P4TUJ5_9PEZI|nr:EXS-domain-containing protein [Tothia fuscella]
MPILFFSGLYPVEFRDFFLGDMFCSQTFALGNVELFFCLYARGWDDLAMCNSSHSRLLGFFTTLPGIWRALQCVRRYNDSKNWYPHLANCGKYVCTILYYVTLSVWRLDKTSEKRALFIVFATLNGVYCTFWDLVNDWSLMDPTAPNMFLRDRLAFKHVWFYYLAILIDPILRFNWILYAIFLHDTQHSTVLSFAVALSEIFRRGIWTALRVENEHCTNVGRLIASRDVPLPYKLADYEPAATTAGVPTDEEEARHSVSPLISRIPSRAAASLQSATGRDQASPPARADGSETSTLRRRRMTESPVTRGLARMGSILHMAHAQDFERRKRPEAGEEKEESGDDESTDDEVDHAESEIAEDDVDAAMEGGDGAISEQDVEEEIEDLERLKTKPIEINSINLGGNSTGEGSRKAGKSPESYGRSPGDMGGRTPTPSMRDKGARTPTPSMRDMGRRTSRNVGGKSGDLSREGTVRRKPPKDGDVGE